MSMSLTGQIDRPPGCQGFPPLDTPATSRRIGSRPLQGRGSLLSLASYSTPANPASRTARAPAFFRSCASQKNRFSRLRAASAVLDPLCNGVADLRHQRRMSHYDNRSKPDALCQACCFGSSSLKPLRKSFTIIQPARKRSGASASICWTVSRSISIRMNIASTAATESPR